MLTLAFVYREAKKIRREKRKYFKKLVNVLEFVTFIFIFCAFAFMMTQFGVVSRRLKRFVWGFGSSSTAMGARDTSVWKDLEHLNACVGLAGNNQELTANGKPEL